MIQTPSTPFSSGTEYEVFKYNWCERCAHCKMRKDGFPEFPEQGGCRILDAMENARFDISEWPKNDIVEEKTESGVVKYWHKCMKFYKRQEGGDIK